MVFTAKVKRIGGSTYLLVPPRIARNLQLEPDQEVETEVQGRPVTVADVAEAFYGIDPDAEYVDRDELWGDYGQRL